MGKLEVYDNTGALKVSQPAFEWHGAAVLLNADSVITTGVETDISTTGSWTQIIDTDAFIDPGTGIFTIPSSMDGKLARFSASVRWDNQATGFRRFHINQDGAHILTVPMGAQSTAFVINGVSYPITVSAGEAYTLSVQHNRGGNTNVEGSGVDDDTFFEIEILGFSA